jgi:hypothetical protein
MADVSVLPVADAGNQGSSRNTAAALTSHLAPEERQVQRQAGAAAGDLQAAGGTRSAWSRVQPARKLTIFSYVSSMWR